MPEVTVKYKSTKALKMLENIVRYFDMVIEKPVSKKGSGKNKKEAFIPIEFAEHPDVKALAGIWKDKDISLNDLRKKAWGNRL